MIRSRLMGALRRQDWMAVAIELATVVFGLFLGLQLNAWNDARQTYSALGFIESQLDYFRQGTTARFAGPSPGMTTVYDPKGPTLQDRFVHTADFDVIAGDRAYMTQLVNALRDQMVFQRYRKAIEAETETMCKSLAQALHKTCAAAAGSAPPVDARAK